MDFSDDAEPQSPVAVIIKTIQPITHQKDAPAMLEE